MLITPFGAGSIIMRIPEKLLMSVPQAQASPRFGAALASHGGGLGSQQILAAFLLYELSCGQQSFWWPYLEQLPRSYTTFLQFTREDASHLQTDYAFDTWLSARESAEKSWLAARPLLTAPGLGRRYSSRQAWFWAASTVSSRTMYLACDAAGALTPLGDLHNHRSAPPPAVPDLGFGDARALGDMPEGCTWGDGSFNDDTHEYCIYARCRYKKGDQVFLCYGQHTNLEFLEHYGFVPKDNPHDRTPLAPSALAGGGQGANAGCRDCGLPPLPMRDCWLHPCGTPCWPLLRELRLRTASPGEARKRGHLARAGQAISGASEVKVFKAIRAACRDALAGFNRSTSDGGEAASAIPVHLKSRAALDTVRGVKCAGDVVSTTTALDTLSGAKCAGDGVGTTSAKMTECAALALAWSEGQKRTLERGIALADRILARHLPP